MKHFFAHLPNGDIVRKTQVHDALYSIILALKKGKIPDIEIDIITKTLSKTILLHDWEDGFYPIFDCGIEIRSV
ncbi:hypothetical protein IMZ31_21775 (plasmid) [Pontibacillus sp. ALD_SL1]|uniref:hypothetical protein n=1 Tax=Pontibacillus sp. ALD_SL1 TaxID=2777185 RepID=UPI001A977C26|nr:hypothetical protein [Pontibacillus sp. ALD_SL1]QST02082.1 hypothetical protein IMZ31_21775 [Pontibacillus sp. ALD_SL1]